MNELTNLLPPDRVAALTREYFVRLATVAVLLLALVGIASGALLAPSYLYVTHQVQAKESHIAELDAALAATHGSQTNKELTDLASTAAYLSRLASTTSATAALRNVLSVPRAGISLTGITYIAATQGTDGKMALTGTATTRESLRAYDDALSRLPTVSNADLPISAFAKDSDIPFTITLSGRLSP